MTVETQESMELHRIYRTGVIVNDARRQPKCKRSSETVGGNLQAFPPDILRTMQSGPSLLIHFAFGQPVYAPGRQLTIEERRHGLDQDGKLQLKGRHG
jgi:hypothetical protein